MRLKPNQLAPTRIWTSNSKFLRLALIMVAGLLLANSAPAQCSTPTTYCTPKISSHGCVPSIGHSGSSRISAADFVVMANQVEGDENYVFIYSFSGATATPFQGGFLCVQPPITRLPPIPPWPNTGGAPDTCNGVMAQPAVSVLMTAGAGSTVWFQGWFRDDAASTGTGLTDGMQVNVCP